MKIPVSLTNCLGSEQVEMLKTVGYFSWFYYILYTKRRVFDYYRVFKFRAWVHITKINFVVNTDYVIKAFLQFFIQYRERCCDIWVLWYLSIVIIEYCDIWVLWYLSIVLFEYCDIWVLWYLSIVLFEYCAIWVLWYLSIVIIAEYDAMKRLGITDPKDIAKTGDKSSR